jgi:cytochrome c oxidase subunit 3
MATHAAAHSHDTHAPKGQSRYFVPEPSAWPFMLTVAIVTLIVGVWSLLEDKHLGSIPLWAGAALMFSVIYRWIRGVARESEGGKYNAQVDRTYRWGMSWFIFSEVMFFGAFFGALFYARQLALPWLSGAGAELTTNLFLWPGFENVWPTNGPGAMGGSFEIIPPWGVPFVNTLLLLSSGVTITLAHHALKDGKRTACILWMWATVALGASFLYFQAGEYAEAYSELNLKLSSGIYGSTFFMLTGFHGMHVTLGTLMLIIITLRLMNGHFKPDSHFGFEGVAWYWHFVDVVWVGLFIFVYIL